jgi:hypothetical protein
MTKKKSKIKRIFDLIVTKDNVERAEGGIKIAKYIGKKSIPADYIDIDLRADLIGAHVRALRDGIEDLTFQYDLWGAFDRANIPEAMKRYRISFLKSNLPKLNEQLSKNGLPNVSSDEIDQNFGMYPARKVKELPVVGPEPYPLPPPSEKDLSDLRRAVPGLFPKEIRDPDYPDDPRTDISEDGDFGGPGGYKSGDLYDTALRYEENPEQLSAAEIFYPGKPVKLTPEQQGYRRVRKDGQPISDAEIFYPDKSRAHEYTYVENDTVSQRQKDADLLYDHPTSQPKT